MNAPELRPAHPATPPNPAALSPQPDFRLPPLDEILAGLRVVRIPLAVRFRGVTEREAALIQGPAGWGEFSPFLEYAPAEASTWLRAAIESAWQGFPEPRRTEIPVNVTVPAVSPSDVERILLRYGADVLDRQGSGLSVKVKVAERGQTLADDIDRLTEIRRLIPQAMVRVDANMGWGTAPSDPAEDTALALDALTRLAEFDLQYAEQPVATVGGLRGVRLELDRRGISLKIAADESIRKAEDPLRVAREDAADLIIVKYAPLGGARRALAVIRGSGLPAVVSSALDTSVGLSAGVALAAALPQLDFACGLATLSLADDDVALAPLTAARGGGSHMYSLPVGPVSVDEGKLESLSAPEAALSWRQRITDCYEVLHAQERAGQAMDEAPAGDPPR